MLLASGAHLGGSMPARLVIMQIETNHTDTMDSNLPDQPTKERIQNMEAATVKTLGKSSYPSLEAPTISQRHLHSRIAWQTGHGLISALAFNRYTFVLVSLTEVRNWSPRSFDIYWTKMLLPLKVYKASYCEQEG